MTSRAIIGIGASAGGLHALESFFSHVEPRTGCTWVVVQHLSPDFKSLMEELLARHTPVPIKRVVDGMAVEPDTIFLMPPQVAMTITDGHFHLGTPDPSLRPSQPIDSFFTSLAQSYGEQAVGVILSGTGSDGAAGVRHIHNAGGLVIVQSEETAEFNGMPQSAIATHTADRVTAPQDMCATILSLLELSSEERQQVTEGPEHARNEILDILHEESGIDFRSYKPNTIERRIERRMGIRLVPHAQDYATILNADKDECLALLNDLLIGVTGFFRDKAAFELLAESVVPNLFTQAQHQEEIRVWVAGCATGQEAYSVAILLSQQALKTQYRGRIRIFATDAHRKALETASAGVYTKADVEDIDEALRERYFEQLSDGLFRVRHTLRDTIVFAPHNLLTDPPFTNLDLVTCRNMLIYLEPRFQDYVLSLFHYSLKINGCMMLGASEGLGQFDSDFDIISSKWKIYSKVKNRALPLALDRLRSNSNRASIRSRAMLPPARRPTTTDASILKDYDAVLNHCRLTGILINEDRQPLHIFGEAGKYLRLQHGRVDDDLLSMVSGDLRIALGTCLQRCQKTRAPATAVGVRTQNDVDSQLVDITIQLLHSDHTQEFERFLFTFQAERDVPNLPVTEHIDDVGEQMRQRIIDLEQELISTKENLQATVEELQTTNEELQSTNEELQSANEELQSANEELHSVNDELYTVNAEYESKNNDLLQLNQDHENLLSSLDVGTVFLDANMRIRKFNPAIERYFSLLDQDIGRPIEHIAYTLHGQDEIIADIQHVVSTGQIRERESVSRTGKPFGFDPCPLKKKMVLLQGSFSLSLM